MEDEDARRAEREAESLAANSNLACACNSVSSKKTYIYEETRSVTQSAACSFASPFAASNPIRPEDPPGTLYLFGMIICFDCNDTPYVTNKRVLPSDMGYEYYSKQAYGGIRNVNYALVKDGSGSIVLASQSTEMEALRDDGAYDFLLNNEFADSDSDAAWDKNVWRAREIKRSNAVCHMSRAEEEKCVSIVKRLVVSVERESAQVVAEQEQGSSGGAGMRELFEEEELRKELEEEDEEEEEEGQSGEEGNECAGSRELCKELDKDDLLRPVSAELFDLSSAPSQQGLPEQSIRLGKKIEKEEREEEQRVRNAQNAPGAQNNMACVIHNHNNYYYCNYSNRNEFLDNRNRRKPSDAVVHRSEFDFLQYVNVYNFSLIFIIFLLLIIISFQIFYILI